MSLVDSVQALSAATVAAVVALHAQWEAGELDEDTYVALTVAVVVRANVKAYALADVAYAAHVSVLAGAPVPAVGLAPPVTEPDRLVKAVRRIVDTSGDPARVLTRLERLADNEPKGAGAKARGEALARDRRAAGWTRGVKADGCKVCRDLAGSVLPKHVPMKRHTGCSCTQNPIMKEAS